jgi:hypothetical protein
MEPRRNCGQAERHTPMELEVTRPVCRWSRAHEPSNSTPCRSVIPIRIALFIKNKTPNQA